MKPSQSPPRAALKAGGAIAFTTYQAGKFFLLGLKSDGKLSVFERTFARCMGLGVRADSRSLLLATQYQLYRFDNALPLGTTQGAHDAVFVPRLSWITGDLDIHDVGFGADGKPVFVNTLFSCLAAASDGWRDKRADGGIAMDVTTNEFVCEGLSMPHSPRLHDGALWLLNSGTGEMGVVDVKRKRFEARAFCPGFSGGLAFAGDHAIAGLSLARENRTFQDLPLDAALARNGAEARCGLIVVDTKNGDTIAWVRIEGVVRELYDVAFIPGVRNPSALGFKSDEILRVITIDEG